jgi:threonine dehydrogenase-like Zn-dependent dehydrogenase
VEATDGRGADVIIETTGVVPSLSAAIDMARWGPAAAVRIITAKEGRCRSTTCISELALINARGQMRPSGGNRSAERGRCA